MSSFAVVHHFKKNLNFNFGKIGHFGTLDPFAEGVLLIGIQGAQKLNDYVHQLMPKTYQARGVFGAQTQTGDLTSPTITCKEILDVWKNASLEELEKFLAPKLLGEYWQSPHAVSAVKFEGKRLYRHALEGRFIEKEKVKREVYAFSILEFNYPYFDFRVTVSSGTYVRTMFEEIATWLGGAGALSHLNREAVGNIKIDQAMRREAWPVKDGAFSLAEFAMPLDKVLELDHINLKINQTKRYVQGQRLKVTDLHYNPNIKNFYSKDIQWVYNEDGTLIGLGRIVDEELHAIFNLSLSIALFS